MSVFHFLVLDGFIFLLQRELLFLLLATFPETLALLVPGVKGRAWEGMCRGSSAGQSEPAGHRDTGEKRPFIALF